ncbi:MAG: cytochrome C assembly family protein [Thermoanaerobaculia bacterium]
MDWHLLGWLAVLLYAGAEALSIASLLRPKASGLAPAFLVAGLALQFVDLQARARVLGSVPYRTLAGSMSLFGWMLGVAYLALLFRHRERSIGPFLIPFVLLFSAAGLLIPFEVSSPRPETQGTLFALHVTLAILGYAAFALSFVLSLLYLVQSRQIRRARTGLLFSQLPALEAIGRLNRTAVSIGLSALFVSVLLGAAWARQVWDGIGDAKLVWALFTLLLYGFLLWMDRRGWKGQRVALLSIVGFGVVIFSYTFVNLYLSRAHTFR